ncbi:glycosyltransferase [Anthocerotibacter panamensis]|uniref:glycosyltransferase n=1 Tax=Anthocerotibacter panamensis TaxID=2857077 RepID=UPI001C40343A|nr:glycosyltransferase [Anthocerotibacter panamensis]
MKVALVHDCLAEYGGAERVLEVLHRLYPEAPVYTAFVDTKRLGVQAERFTGWDVHTTMAQSIPGIARCHHTLRFLIPYFWEGLDLSGYDLVLSSSSGYLSKSVLTRPETLHITYCHTPPRYLWGYRARPSTVWYRQVYEGWVNNALRQYDFCASQRVDHFIANSHTVARRIAKFYRRTATVIPPPVNVRGEGRAGDSYYLYVGRLTRPKQVDLAVHACNRLKHPLWIVGEGSEEARLRSLAGPQVRFLGALPDQQIAAVYAGAKGLLYPCAHEDFGIVPVEALGHGVPVLALAQGGVCESILAPQTGLFFSEPTVESLCTALEQFDRMHFSARACHQRAQEFSESVFLTRIQQFIDQCLEIHLQQFSGCR